MNKQTMNRKVRLSVAILFVLVFAFTAFACIGALPTVSFVNGNVTVATIEVSGAVKAEQIPEAPEKEGYAFEGWFVGETKVEEGFKAEGRVTANAVFTKLHTVTFTSGYETVAKITVKDGSAIGTLPEAPLKDGYEFKGWFVGENAIGEDFVVTQNTTVVAVFNEEFTLAFEASEGEIVKTVAVESGNSVGTLPEAPLKEGYAFMGWFVGGEKITNEYKPVANVTVKAKYEVIYTVTFVNENKNVAVVEVVNGNTVNLEEIPADPTKKDHTFNGWYAGEELFTSNTVITENKTYVASYALSTVYVTFVAGEEESVATVQAKEDGSFALEATHMPVVPTKAGYVFFGWYNGNDKVEAGYALTSNVTAEAFFVNAESYVGTWVTEDYKKFEIGIKNGELEVAFNAQSYADWSYDEETATITGRYYGHFYRLTLTKAGISVYHMDDMEWEYNYEFVKHEGAAPVQAGEYRLARNSDFTVSENGMITKFNNSTSFYYAQIKAVEGGYQIVYLSSSYSASYPTLINLVEDEKGNLVVSEGSYAGIYVNASESHYYNAKDAEGNTHVLIQHVTDSGNVFVYKANGVYAYANYEGLALVGATATVTVGESVYNIKITEGSFEDKEEGAFAIRGAEYGEYTNGTDTIALDGFGKATHTGFADSHEYIINGNLLVITVNGVTYGYEISEGTFTEKAKDAYAGTYRRDGNENKYYFILDGFGNIIDYYVGSYSTSVYYNTYTVSGSTINVKVDGYSYNVKGALTIEENGNVLIYIYYSSTYVYVKEGVTIEDKTEDFVGETEGNWKDANGNEVLVDVESGKITYGGNAITYTANYNHSVITFKAYDANDYYGNSSTYTAKVVDGALVITHDIIIGYDPVYEEYTSQTITETFAPFEGDKTDDFVGANNGSWKDADGNYVTIDVVNKTITIYGDTVTYTANANHSVITFDVCDPEDNYPSVERTHTAVIQEGKLVITHERMLGYDWTYEEYITENITQILESSAPAVEEGPFTGTWEGPYYDLVFVDANTLTFDGVSYEYTVTSNGVLQFSTWAYDFEGTINSSGKLVLTYFDWDMYEEYSITFTKATTGSAYDGTYTDNYGRTVVVSGNSVAISGFSSGSDELETTHTVSISGNTCYIYIGDFNYNGVTIVFYSDYLNIYDDYGNFSYSLYK